MNRQALFVVVLVSAVAGVLAAFGTATVLRPARAAGEPGSTAALAEELKALRLQLASLGEGKLDRAAFDSGLASLGARLSALEKAGPAGGAGEAKPAAAPALPGGAEAFLGRGNPDEAMRAMGELMRVQLKQGRDRFVNDLLNPSEASLARQRREVNRWAGMVSGNLGLSEAERATVEQVLAEVDQARRDRLRQVFQSKPLEEITYAGDLKSVIDESFTEEDQRISQLLPPEKAEQYKQNADMVRGFITTMASAAFPDPK